MLRGVASLVAGFMLVPVLMWMALSAVLAVWPGLLPSSVAGAADAPVVAPPLAFMVVNLGLAALTAGVSAAVTARLAPDPAFLWVLLLAFLVFAGGLVFGVQQIGGAMPTWYLLAMPLASGLSIAAGGYGYLTWHDHHDERRTT
ncbi:MAG TPA: hypothetical protein VLA33_07245 [Gemmatimonadota bacterium]|nr:hypothetical protein [Gemmatimonadota bacterium]